MNIVHPFVEAVFTARGNRGLVNLYFSRNFTSERALQRATAVQSANFQSEDLIGRLVDVAVSATALVVLLPVLVAMAIWLAIDSPGNPFHRAWRVGRGGRKFRSMTRSNGPGITGRGDARITRSGAILRRTKLDELPQFLNVLAGI